MIDKDLIKKIITERIKAMPYNIKISLGNNFLNKNQMLNEISNNTKVGKKIINIQFKYLRALTHGEI